MGPEAECRNAIQSHPDMDSAVIFLLKRPQPFHSSPLTRLPLQVRISLICFLSVRVGMRLGIAHAAFVGLRLASMSSLTLSNLLPTGRPELVASAFRAVTRWCDGLKGCDLSSYCLMNDHDLRFFTERCGSSMQDLCLSGCRSITDKGLMAVADFCKGLRTLNLAGCQAITDNGLQAISQNCTKLHTLYLSDCYRVTHKVLAALALGCPDLQILCIRGCQHADPRRIPTKLRSNRAFVNLLERTQTQYYSRDGRYREFTRPPMTPIFNTDIRSGI